MRKGSKQGDWRGGDRREGAAGNELSSALSEGRRKRELSEQIRTKKRLGLGLKTSNRSDRFGLPVRPVRRRGVTLIRRSVLAGHRRPLLCRGVAHNVADRATGSVPEEEEAIAGPPETDLANAGQLTQKGE